MAKTIVSGTFGATGQSANFPVLGKFNALLSGGVGTVALEKSYDGGTVWFGVTDALGVLIVHTMVSDVQLNAVLEEPEPNIQYRWNCTAFTSGVITYRLSHS